MKTGIMYQKTLHLRLIRVDKNMRKRSMILLMLIIFCMTTTFVQAALRIQTGSFSCSGQAGIELGDTFSCQATIENPDVGIASITSITLNVNGNWLEQTSYTGSGFSTTVSGSGGTTSVASK